MSGETLAGIAESMTGDPARVSEIVHVNMHRAPTLVVGTWRFPPLIPGEYVTIPDNWGNGTLGANSTNPNKLAEDVNQKLIHEVWIPLAIGTAALVAGVGLAYIVTRPPKTVSQIAEEEARKSR